MTEEGGTCDDKRPSEVSDCTENISVDTQQTLDPLHPLNQAVQPHAAGHKVSLCPVATDPKPSPRKLWVVSQESFQKCPLESQKEALHTGTGEFSTIDDQVKLFKDSAVIGSHGFPQSPEGDNIAVSFDSSSLESSRLDADMGTHKERPTSALGFTSGVNSPSSLPVQLREVNADCVSSDIPFTATFDTPMGGSSDPCMALSLNLREEPDCLEEGEIIEDTNNPPLSEPIVSLILSKQPVMSSDQQGNIDVTSSSSNSAAHVVREEVSSSSEPSELVTSSSNSLATIKRKIESLKNKRAGKLRKLDKGGAVAWPTENNIAVRPLQIGITEAPNGRSFSL